MRIPLFQKFDKTKPIGVAVSGGVDSVALLNIMVQWGYKCIIVHFKHAYSTHAPDALKFVAGLSSDLDLPMYIRVQPENKTEHTSKEEFWRNGRREFFNDQKMPIVTAHTLDDAVEWYLMSTCSGLSKIIPYNTQNVFRPLLLTRKQKLIEYSTKNGLSWIEDPSNQDTRMSQRNKIRHEVIPRIEEIYPGIYKVVKKKILENR